MNKKVRYKKVRKIRIKNGKVTLGFIIIILIIAFLMWLMFFKAMNNQKNNAFNPNKATSISESKNEGKFAIEVKDEEGTPVPGIEFILYDVNMQEVIHIITNSNGQAGAKNLPYGKYKYKEENSDTLKDFELTEKQKTVTLRMKREQVEEVSEDE